MYPIVILTNGSKKSDSVVKRLTERQLPVKTLMTEFDPRKDYEAAYRLAQSNSCFFVVDSTYWIYDSFDFEFTMPIYDYMYIHVFETDGNNKDEIVPNFGGVRLFSNEIFVDGKLGSVKMKYIQEKCGLFMTHKDFSIRMLCKDEENCDSNLLQLRTIHPSAYPWRATGNIYESHKNMADTSWSQMFAVVDGDCWVDKPFLLEGNHYNYARVNVWQVRNPVNGLVYGHGGPKLFSRHLFQDKKQFVDMTLSLTQHIEVHPEVVGSHMFNWSAYNTWRTAFRECVKLSMAEDAVSKQRLKVWTEFTYPKQPFAKMCLLGARAGYEYAQRTDFDKFKINDEVFLRKLFKDKVPW